MRRQSRRPLPMPSYRDLLSPWCIIRAFPNSHTLIVARFRRRNDAEAHLNVLRHLIPEARFSIVFDTPKHPLDPDSSF